MTIPAEVNARFAAVLGAATGVEVSRRDRRWLALGDEIVAFAADDDAGWARLVAEGKLLARWRAADVPAPRLLDEDAARRVQVRERMHGIMGEVVEPLLFGGPRPEARQRYSAEIGLTPFGARLAASYGEVAARIHAAVPAPDAPTLGLEPQPVNDFARALELLRAAPSVSAATVAAVERALPWLVATSPATVVVHGDLHFHNLCLAPDGTITGVFDLDAAGPDVAELDLQYVHGLGPRFAEIAVRAYGRPLDPDAIGRAHLRTALAHILWHGPARPRHAGIVAWITAAFEAIGPWHSPT